MDHPRTQHFERPDTPLPQVNPWSQERQDITRDRDHFQRQGTLPNPTYSHHYADRAGRLPASVERHQMIQDAVLESLRYMNLDNPSPDWQQIHQEHPSSLIAQQRFDAALQAKLHDNNGRPDSPDLTLQEAQQARAWNRRVIQGPPDASGHAKIHDIIYHNRTEKKFTQQKHLNQGNFSEVLRGKREQTKEYQLPEGIAPYEQISHSEVARRANETKGPQGRSETSRRANETRKQNKKAQQNQGSSSQS